MKSNYFLERVGISYCVRLHEGANSVGRAFDSTVRISGTFGSRNHCRITVDNDKLTLEDFSFNGTYINEVECKATTSFLKENDKIGIGVHSVDNSLEENSIYHVYLLRKISCKSDATKNQMNVLEDEIIQLSDSEEDISDDSRIFKKPAKQKTQYDVTNNKKEADFISKSKNQSQLNLNSKTKPIQDSITEISVQNDSNTNSNLQSKTKNNTMKCESTTVPNDDFLDFQSDELSQAVWDEIKEEIAELDLSELQSNDDEDLVIRNNDVQPVIDILDLTLDDKALKDDDNDDEEELDGITRQWFMKLSQNFDESFEKKPSPIKSKKTEIPEKNIDIELNHTIKDTSKTENLLTNKKSEDSKTENLNEFNAEKCLAKIKKRRSSAILIEALTLPTKRGAQKSNKNESIKSVSKSPTKKKISSNNTPKKSLRNHYSSEAAKTLRSQKKWLEKPNILNEKAEIKQLLDKRKEKLKQLAELYCEKGHTTDDQNQKLKRKNSVGIEELESEERCNIIKKARVKITDKNRGAFLTEISSSTGLKATNVKDIKTLVSDRTVVSDAEYAEKKLPSKVPKIKIPKKRGINVNITEKTINKKSENCDLTKSSHKSVKRGKSLKVSEIDENKICLKPCLKAIGNINLKKKTSTKSVRFDLKPTIHTFEVVLDVEQNNDNIPSKHINNKNLMRPDLSHFDGRKRVWRLKRSSKGVNISDNILSEILSWKSEWFNDANANINGTSTVFPMLHSFKTLEEYQRIIFPLMKLELWERLIKDKQRNSRKYIELNIKNTEIENKVIIKRIVFNCEYKDSSPLNKPLFYASELLLLRSTTTQTVFGHVRSNHCLNATSTTKSKTYAIQIECNLNHHTTNMNDIKTIEVQKISVIATELGAFEAVKNLTYSPIMKSILNPLMLIEKIGSLPENDLKNFKYNGYDKLNEIQQNILMQTYLRAINSSKESITFIEGPPGTGKSRLITNLVLQLQYGLELRQLDRKVLVCAQSNTAVDVITRNLIRIRQKMSSKKFRLVRYGVLDKMHPEVKPYSLSELIKLQKRSTMQNPNMIALMQERDLIEQKINRLENSGDPNSKDDSELNKAKKDLNQIKTLLGQNSSKVDRDLEYKFLVNANVVCTTLSSCVRLLRYCNFFDVCIVDEATQCNEPWILVPLQFGINSLILIGDTQQLPATTLSHLSKLYNYGKSYFTRAKELAEDRNKTIVMNLKVQYRMHSEISKWPNMYFYKNSLENGERTLNIKSVVKPYTVIELNFNQNKLCTNGEISNCLEADFVLKLIQGLVELMPTKQFSYGIITPYNLHCQNLREKLRREKLEIEVNTIDSYQGKEKDIIIMSNARTEGIGFLNEISRLNVALTRAKECLVLCGNFRHLEHVNVWKSLLADAKERGVYFEPNKNDLTDFKNKIIGRLKI